jgi:protein arginine kinase activator
MKCDLKECATQATVHLTEVVNGNITKLHLCEEHAKRKGIEMEQHFGIADLLQGLAEFSGSASPTKITGKTKCQNCSMVYDDFKKIGRLGCSHCYEAFELHLAPLLKRIHGSNEHTGKLAGETEKKAVPLSQPVPAAKPDPLQGQGIESLKVQLKQAIQSEAYESAAVLRDKIRRLESKPKSKKKG